MSYSITVDVPGMPNRVMDENVPDRREAVNRAFRYSENDCYVTYRVIDNDTHHEVAAIRC